MLSLHKAIAAKGVLPRNYWLGPTNLMVVVGVQERQPWTENVNFMIMRLTQ